MSDSTRYCINCGTANPSQALFCFSCGQAIPKVTVSHITPTGSLAHDHLLNQRYRILDQLGEGGFGSVYKAEDTLLGGRLVAVKEMSQSGLKPSEVTTAVESFKREALMLASLTHPNLPRIYDHFQDGGRWYLAMDFIAGQTLEESLSQVSKRGGPVQALPLEEVFDIGGQLCSVLDYLHNQQPAIIFRDLKPANVILSPEGHLYLIDFGIARHFKPGQNKDTIAFGSPGYAAPEQYGRIQTNPRADIYSLGATLHQMLTGQDPSLAPFRFQPLRQYSPAIPEDLDTLVMQMLDMDEHKRPISAVAIKKELLRISTQPSSQQSRISTVSTSSPSVTSSTAMGHAITTYCEHSDKVNALGWSPDEKLIVSASSASVRVWDMHSGRTRYVYRGHSGAVNAVAWSPDGRYVATAGDDGTVQVWMVMRINDVVTGSYVCEYRNHESEVNAVAWSPDGRYIASSSVRETVHIWGAMNGHPLIVGSRHVLLVQSLSWSPDGKYLVMGCLNASVKAWNIQDGNMLFSNRTPTDVHSVVFSPDGKRIAFGCADRTVHCLDFATREELRVYSNHDGCVRSVSWSPDCQYIASAGDDGTVHIWEANSGQTQFVYRAHLAQLYSVAWSPGGRYIASAGEDHTVQVWKMQ